MKPFHVTYKLIRRLVIISIGVTILAIGVVMVVMPGPAFVMIPLGLAILGLCLSLLAWHCWPSAAWV